MRPIQILTDSCSDLTAELMERYGIDYAKMNTSQNGKETPASLSWEAYTPQALYNAMRQGEIIKTTQVPNAEFEKVFGHYLAQGCDIIYIGCSTKQSGSVNTATVLAKRLMQENPGAKIYCVDSLNASMGEGLLAIFAATLVKEGHTVDQVYEAVQNKRNFVQQYITVNTLEYLRRAGRVKGSAAFFGNLMGIKPILISDAAGVQTPIKKVKGRENSLREVVSLMKEGVIDPENQTAFLVHADCPAQEVETLRRLLQESIPFQAVYDTYIGPIIGASIGPNAIGVFAFGKEVTYEFKG